MTGRWVLRGIVDGGETWWVSGGMGGSVPRWEQSSCSVFDSQARPVLRACRRLVVVGKLSWCEGEAAAARCHVIPSPRPSPAAAAAAAAAQHQCG